MPTTRTADDHRLTVSSSVFALVGTAAVLFMVQVIVGALQIWTTLAPWTVTLHLSFGAAIWGLLAAATLVAWYDARVGAAPVRSPDPARQPAPPGHDRPSMTPATPAGAARSQSVAADRPDATPDR